MNNTTSLLSRFRDTVTSSAALEPHAPELLIERVDSLACHYAPFDHVNTNAKIVLLGLTPGAQQARNAITALRDALKAGLSDTDALRQAKEAASFSGPMRSNLVAMLDHLGLQRTLGIGGCAELFTTRTDLVHFTSALRYPVFANGQNYSGSPSLLGTPFLRSMADRWLAEEVAALPDAWWIPLGKEATAALNAMAQQGRIHGDRILDGMPHPSGANAERIAYFLGNKRREELSAKTSADRIDTARHALLSKVKNAGKPVPTSIPHTSDHPAASVGSALATTAKPVVGTRTRGDRFATTFVLRDYQGRPIHPVRSRKGTFTLAPRGADMHRAEHAIHIEDEDTAFQMVSSGTYRIRAVREEGQAPSLIGVGDRVAKSAERIK